MKARLEIIQGPYLRDLLAQPDAVEHTWAELRPRAELADVTAELHQGQFDRVVLTGMGTSFHALQPLLVQLVAAGAGAHLVETSELVHCQRRLLTGRSLAIVVSQSGESAEVVRLLEIVPPGLHILAVTNSPESTLARQADTVVPTRAGPEAAVSCKTYLAALTALVWVGAALEASDHAFLDARISDAVRYLRDYLSAWHAHIESLAERMEDQRLLYLVGRGVSLAAVGSGALILKESARFPAEGLSAAAFRHGPLEIVGPGVAVGLFEGATPVAALNRRLAGQLRESSTRVLWMGHDAECPSLCVPTVPDPIRPLLEILPLQMLSLALAALAGREAGRFERASKITILE